MDASVPPKVEQDTNGWVRRVKGLAEILATPQGMLAVLLLLFIGMAIGKLPFAPLDRLNSSASAHNATMVAAIEAGKADRLDVRTILREMLSTQALMAQAIMESGLRDRLEACDKFKAPDIRDRCLKGLK